MLPFSLKDLLALLDRWEPWKRIAGAPGRLDEIERRLAALEARPATPATPPCGYCGGVARLTHERPDPTFGTRRMVQTWTCDECGKNQTRERGQQR